MYRFRWVFTEMLHGLGFALRRFRDLREIYATSFMEAETTARVGFIGFASIDCCGPVSKTNNPMTIQLFNIKQDVEKHLGNSVENAGVEGLESHVDYPMGNEIDG